MRYQTTTFIGTQECVYGHPTSRRLALKQHLLFGRSAGYVNRANSVSVSNEAAANTSEELASINAISFINHSTRAASPAGVARVDCCDGDSLNQANAFESETEFLVRESLNYLVQSLRPPDHGSLLEPVKVFKRDSGPVFFSEPDDLPSYFVAPVSDEIALLPPHFLEGFGCSSASGVSQGPEVRTPCGKPFLPVGDVLAKIKLFPDFVVEGVVNSDGCQAPASNVNTYEVVGNGLGRLDVLFDGRPNHATLVNNAGTSPAISDEGVESLPSTVLSDWEKDTLAWLEAQGKHGVSPLSGLERHHPRVETWVGSGVIMLDGRLDQTRGFLHELARQKRVPADSAVSPLVQFNGRSEVSKAVYCS